MLGLITAAIVACIAALVFMTERRGYKVHNNGLVLVTGASSGIGKHAAEFLAENYEFVVLAGVRRQSDFDQIASLNRTNLVPLMIDVSSRESCSSAARRIAELSSATNLPLVGLVNNAGLGGFNPLEFEDMTRAREIFETNVFGVMDLTQLLLPSLRKSQGRIVMISSLAGVIATEFSGVYCASKFALEGLSDALRRELLPHGVSVSVVQPAYVRTEIIARSVKATEDVYREQKEAMLAVYPRAIRREEMPQMMAGQPGPDTTTTPAIEHALTAAYPKTRYPVATAQGKPAQNIAWLVWMLSDRLEDLIA